MEKVLILGPSVTDIVQEVNKLPKEGEEIVPLLTRQRISGMGYCAAHLFSLLDMPALLYTNPGSGLYGDFVQAGLDREKIEWISRNEETAGCLYTLVDSSGNAVRMAVPGSEYGFLPYGHAEAGTFVLLDGSYLYDETADLFPEIFTDEARTVLFCPHYAGIEADPDLFRTLLESSPWLYLSEEEAAAYGEGKDLGRIASDLHALTQKPVIILRSNGSGYFLDGADAFETDSRITKIKDRTGMGEAFAAGFLLAKNAGADNRSALSFACECAALAASSESSVIEAKDKERVRNLLVQAILTESRGGRMQDFLS